MSAYIIVLIASLLVSIFLASHYAAKNSSYQAMVEQQKQQVAELIKSNTLHKNDLVKLNDKYENINAKFMEVNGVLEKRALEKFHEFKNLEINQLKVELEKDAVHKARLQLEEWKMNHEQTIRQDAILRSQSVTLGKVTEHVIPFHNDFPFNPKDARFIGSPLT